MFVSELSTKIVYENLQIFTKFHLFFRSRSLIPALQENARHREAAEIVKYFNQDGKQLIKILCDGRLYQEAIFESTNSTESHFDFISSHLTDFSKQTIEKVRADNVQFKAHVARLQAVRKQKAEKLLNGDVDDDIGDCDMFSDTTSMNSSRFSGSSRHSGVSRRSGKNRRKHERKLMSLKEGNPFEDIALIDALYTLSTKIYEQQQQIHDLLQSLIDLDLDSIGVELQKVYNQSLNDISVPLNEIWLPELMVSGEIKFDDIINYFEMQKEQHYAMISEFFTLSMNFLRIK